VGQTYGDYTLFEHQSDCRDSIFHAWDDLGIRRVPIMMPTGTGKTLIGGAVITDFIKKTGRRALFLNHRRELVEQTEKKFLKMGLEVEVEMGVRKASKSALSSSDVVVGSIQSLQGYRLQQWPRHHFGLIVFDEVHHVVSSQAQRVLDYFENYKFLGVSATYDRADRKSLGDFFTETSKPVYEFPLFDAIELGFLAELEVRRIKTGIDLKKVKKTAEGKDISLDEVSERLTPLITKLCRDVFIPECESRQTILFAPSVRCAEAFAACLNSLGKRARSVSSFDSQDDRVESLNLFHQGTVQYLANFGILGEGFDEPSIAAGIGARPTTSRPLYAQMVGRILRVYEGKQKAVWIDLVMNSETLNLVHPLDLFSTSNINPNVLDRAKQIVDGTAEPCCTAANDRRSVKDLCKAVREAEEEESGLPYPSRRHLVVEASRAVPKLNYERAIYNPLGARACGLVKFAKWDNIGSFRATPNQCNLLRQFKVRDPECLGRRGASKLIDAILERQRKRPDERESATYAQLNLLIQKGVPEHEAKQLSKNEAIQILDKILRSSLQHAATENRK
jgi:superfamily II DNA or RNA helicase